PHTMNDDCLSQERNLDWFEFLKKDFVQGFTAFVGFEVTRAEYGMFESCLKILNEHRQQDGFVHAGVIAAIADHTSGYASFTTVPEKFRILTIEFKINFFKPATGPLIVCRSRVINNGRKIKVGESQVFSVSNGTEKLVAKGMFTHMAVPSEEVQGSSGLPGKKEPQGASRQQDP
ncbi:MAG: PaaI family thioesterase, partial [Desulfomonilia bacterium]|nr:PaaI family thioesterase [Desulfomonilia bacterium]